MSVIDRIKSISKKLGVTVTGETIVELLASLEDGLDKKVTSSAKTESVVSTVRNSYKKQESKKSEKTDIVSRKKKNEDDE